MAVLLVSAVAASAEAPGLPAPSADPDATVAAPAPSGLSQPGIVVVGRAPILTLRTDAGAQSASMRAAAANARIESLIEDPECGPERFRSVPGETAGTVVIEGCAKPLLTVTSEDAAIEGTDVAALAVRWETALGDAFGTTKQAVYSGRLVRRALLGLLYPLGFLVVLGLAHILFRRVSAWLLGAVGRAGGVAVGPARILRTEGERRWLRRGLAGIQLVVYLALSYLFLLGLFTQFPGTARWAVRMGRPMTALWRTLAEGASTILPPLVLAVLVFVAMWVALRAVGGLFGMVRTGRVRLEPVLRPETAGAAELITRVLIVAAALALLGLSLPGEPGVVLLALLAFTALAIALAAREAVSNLLAGLFTLYGRPFHRGERIRIGSYEGRVERKGTVHLSLRVHGGNLVLIPNHQILALPVEILDGGPVLRLEAVLRVAGQPDTAAGIFRHAAALAGLDRAAGRIELVAIRGGLLVYQLEWPLPRGEEGTLARGRFLLSLQEKAAGMHVEVVSATMRGEPSP